MSSSHRPTNSSPPPIHIRLSSVSLRSPEVINALTIFGTHSLIAESLQLKRSLPCYRPAQGASRRQRLLLCHEAPQLCPLRGVSDPHSTSPSFVSDPTE